jgi:hypothetical protein
MKRFLDETPQVWLLLTYLLITQPFDLGLSNLLAGTPFPLLTPLGTGLIWVPFFFVRS